MAEDLDNLLAVYHFLDISVHIPDALLLFHEILARHSGNFFHQSQYNECKYSGNQGQPYAQMKH